MESTDAKARSQNVVHRVFRYSYYSRRAEVSLEGNLVAKAVGSRIVLVVSDRYLAAERIDYVGYTPARISEADSIPIAILNPRDKATVDAVPRAVSQHQVTRRV